MPSVSSKSARLRCERASTRRRPATRRSVQRHVSFTMILAGVLIGLWALSGAHFFWPALPLFFLFMSVVRHTRQGRPEFGRPHRVHLGH